MQRYTVVLRKAGWGLFTVGFVLVLNFFLFRVLPGDPARAGVRDPRLSPQAQREVQAIERLKSWDRELGPDTVAG